MIEDDRNSDQEERQPHPPRSTTDILLLIAAIGVVVVNVVTVYTSAQTMGKVDAAREQSIQAATQADEKLDGIHELANANLSAANESLAEVNKQLQDANNRIGKLETLLSQEKAPEKPTEEKP